MFLLRTLFRCQNLSHLSHLGKDQRSGTFHGEEIVTNVNFKRVENAVLKMSPHQLLRARLSNDLAVSLAPPLLFDHPVHLQGVAVLLGVLAEGQGDVRLSHDLLVLGAVFVVVVVIVGRHRPWRPVVGRVRWLAAVTAVVNGVI